MLKSIDNKAQWYSFLKEKEGVLNSAVMYSTNDFLRQYLSFDFNTKWMFRYKKQIGGKSPVFYTLDMVFFINQQERSLLPFTTITKVLDDDAIIVQGHWNGMFAECSFDKVVIKDTLLNKRLGKLQLKILMGPWFDVMDSWLDYFPNHIIEFSFYSKGQGILNEPLMIWEIRNY